MKARDIMSKDVACSTPENTIQQVARLMEKHDCGVPVEDAGTGRVVGVVTDRDIAIRGAAAGSRRTSRRAVADTQCPWAVSPRPRRGRRER